MAVAPASGAARAVSAVIAAVAILSLSVQAADLVGRAGLPPLEALWTMAQFLTVLTTVLVALTHGAIAIGLARPRTLWQAALFLSVLLVTVGYHLLLRGVRPLQGLGVWADLGFHTVLPILVAFWWAVFAPKSRLRLDHVPGMLTWPVIYTSYALTRGSLESNFPYPFLDPLAIGWTPVIWNMAEFAALLALGGVILVFLGKILPDPSRRYSSPGSSSR